MILDNEWNSQFYVCDDYILLEEEDEDWACDWTDDIEGPCLGELADIVW